MMISFYVNLCIEVRDFLKGFNVKIHEYFRDMYSELIQYPRWFLMRKMGRFHGIRRYLSEDFSGQSIVPDMLLKEKSSHLKCLDSASFVADRLREFGIYQGILLDNYVVEKIKQFALENPCYANRDPSCGFLLSSLEIASNHIKKEILRANYYNLESQCEIVSALKTDPILRKIAALYLQTTPVHVSSILWWSFPANSNLLQKSKSAQVFHCDLDDFRFLKFFFYLTDVDTESGPHIFIRGSHIKKPFFRQLLRGRASEAWLQKYYSPEEIISICGSAGFGFVEDTYGHHKGTSPKSKRRLILQIEYASHDYGNLHDMMDERLLKQLALPSDLNSCH